MGRKTPHATFMMTKKDELLLSLGELFAELQIKHVHTHVTLT